MKKYKTIQKHLKDNLSTEEYMKALQYIDKITLQKKVENASFAIKEGFVWNNTFEGCSYWGNIFHKLML